MKILGITVRFMIQQRDVLHGPFIIFVNVLKRAYLIHYM